LSSDGNGAGANPGTTSSLPPPEYWKQLAASTPEQRERLHALSDQRLNEFRASSLPPPIATAETLLETVAADGWLSPQQRLYCPLCEHPLDDREALNPVCPNCDAVFGEHGGVAAETVYVRHLPSVRTVDWVVAIHGMNTRGEWQEEFTWHFATTWGRSVPVAIYKYGTLRAGVLSPRHRQQLREQLRAKLLVLQAGARAHGFLGNPDVVAHSFGTWLLGHLLESELDRDPGERLSFGRLILLGSILPRDFDWVELQQAGVVEDVLNHCASEDKIVGLARFGIAGSGPSGRVGFTGEGAINVLSAGCRHSDLLSIDTCASDGRCCECTGAAMEAHALEHFYARYWRPFLTLPKTELRSLSNWET
jgi:hypothetical protein